MNDPLVIPYSTDQFNAAYYGSKENGGFGTEIQWENPIQQNELAKKFEIVSSTGALGSILFIGCAFGWEVRYFVERGINAHGVDVSEHAINTSPFRDSGRIHLYNGWDLSRYTTRFDVVAVFDVLTLLPDDMLARLCGEMRRVCDSRIVFRTIIRSKTSKGRHWIGRDGVSFRYLSFEDWDSHFSDGFDLRSVTINQKREGIFVFGRV